MKLNIKFVSYGRSLDRLVKLAQTRKGTVTEVCRLYHKHTGEPIFRQTIEAWLRPDITKRTEPRLSAGLVLLRIQSELCDD